MRKLSILFFAIISLIMISIPTFAQTSVSTGLKDSDVKAFIKNYSKIEKGLEKLDIDIDSENATYINEITQIQAVENLLQANGISGPNRLYKIVAISNSYAYLTIEEEMAKDPEAAKMMKEMGLDMSTMLVAQTNPADTKVVKANMKGLKEIFEKEDNSYDDVVNEDVFNANVFD